MSQEELPPRSGEPLEVWTYRDRPCAIYRIGSYSQVADDRENLPPRIKEMYETAWCGYTKTTLEGGYDEIPVRVFGGLTYGVTDDGWVGFDTMHGFHGGPQSIEAVKEETENLVDQ